MIRADGTGAGIQNDANNNNILLRNVTIDSNDGAGIRTSVALTMTDRDSEEISSTFTGKVPASPLNNAMAAKHRAT